VVNKYLTLQNIKKPNVTYVSIVVQKNKFEFFLCIDIFSSHLLPLSGLI